MKLKHTDFKTISLDDGYSYYSYKIKDIEITIEAFPFRLWCVALYKNKTLIGDKKQFKSPKIKNIGELRDFYQLLVDEGVKLYEDYEKKEVVREHYRKIASMGGKAAAAKMTKAQRIRRAKIAVTAREAKRKKLNIKK